LNNNWLICCTKINHIADLLLSWIYIYCDY